MDRVKRDRPAVFCAAPCPWAAPSPPVASNTVSTDSPKGTSAFRASPPSYSGPTGPSNPPLTQPPPRALLLPVTRVPLAAPVEAWQPCPVPLFRCPHTSSAFVTLVPSVSKDGLESVSVCPWVWPVPGPRHHPL